MSAAEDASEANSKPGSTTPTEIEPHRAIEPPVIDGMLDDSCWKSPPLELSDWLTYNPSYGEVMAQKTKVWIAYDDSYIYFAFRCLDPEPDKIKNTMSRRDRVFNDDWVGLSLDAMGSGQSAYDMFVNPSGIQMDILTSSTAGEDLAPDWVWDSAGRINEEGYDAEIRLPLKSIRFKSGDTVRMGILFWRRVSRLGMSASWPDLPPGQFVLTRHRPLLFRNLRQPLTLEAIPYFTYSLSQTRSAHDRWRTAESKPNGGITMKYGLTSSVTLDGTFNPDFSQVESDAFQVEVNQRFPIFFSEKRPFFMEGTGTFELAGTSGGDGNVRTAVHTRRIIDPLFGIKLSGTLGKVTFATLSASDEAPGRLPASHPDAGRNKTFNIARAIYSLGKNDYVGALITDTEFAGSFNRALAGDLSLRIGEHQRWSSTIIGTESRDGRDIEKRSGMAAQTTYGYSSKRYDFVSQLEHYDRDFHMDTAFYNRTGITTVWSYGGVSFYPDQKKHPWLKRIVPFAFAKGGRDRIQEGNEYFALGGVRLHLTRQGFLLAHAGRGRESWVGKTFDTDLYRVLGGAQVFKWLNFFGNVSFSRSIFYDPQRPFSGNQWSQFLNLSLQPSEKLNQNISFNRVAFDRADNGAEVFRVQILNSRTSYQFDKHFSVRSILQYDSSRTRILADFLGSYEFVPGTVAYIGYGSLFEKGEWDGERFIPGRSAYLNTQRGLFFKVSYLYRF